MLARFGRIAIIAVIFAAIASGIITVQFMMDGLPFDARFVWACLFFSACVVALSVGYGLGDELRRAWIAGGFAHAWPWLAIIAISAGLFWSLSTAVDSMAGMSVGPFPPMLLVLGVPTGAIGLRRKPKP
jgi:hypothetical protein